MYRYDLWEQLAREVVAHLQSDAFKSEFPAFVKDDEANIRLFSLHLFLIA